MRSNNKLADVFEKREHEIASKWLELQFSDGQEPCPTAQTEAKCRSRDFLSALKNATRRGNGADINGSDWDPVRDFLTDLSASRAKNGYSPSQTASFVFS